MAKALKKERAFTKSPIAEKSDKSDFQSPMK